MAEKRANCKAAAQSLSKVIGYEISASEVAGTRVTELDNLTSFYKRYEELLGDINPILATQVSENKAQAIPIAEFQKLLAKALPLKLLPTYSDLAARTKALSELVTYSAKWLQDRVSQAAITAIPEGPTTIDPTLNDLVAFLKAKPAEAVRLSGYAAAEAKARAVIEEYDALKAAPATSYLANTKPLELLYSALKNVIDATAESYNGRSQVAVIKEAFSALRDAKFIVDEVALLSTLGAVSVLGPDAITQLHNATLAAEGMKRDSSSSVSEFTGLHSAAQSSAIAADVQGVKSQMKATCEKARAKLPSLSALSDSDVIRYSAIGDVATSEAQAFTAKLFPWWRRLVIVDGNVTDIEGTSGERLTLNHKVPADAPLSDVLPLVVAEQRKTIERLTLHAHSAAHDVAIGRKEFTPELFLPLPSQVAVRLVLLLWTELTEGAIGSTSSPAAGPATASGNANQSIQIMRHVSSGSRSPSRPTSAASRQSRISSPRKSVVDDPRPGSASATLFRKSTKSDEKNQSKLSQLIAAEQFDASLSRPSTTSSARTRRITTAAALPVPASAHISTSRAQSSIASLARLTPILFEHLRLTQTYLSTTALSEENTNKLRSIIQWQHRLATAWELKVKKAANSEDYLWKREPRLYVTKRQAVLQQNEYSLAMDHHFIPLDPHFILSNTDQLVWQHLMLMRSIHRPALFVNYSTPIEALASICGQPIVAISSPSQLPQGATTGLAAIMTPEALPAQEQQQIAQWLGDYEGDCVILCESLDGLHPFFAAHASPFLTPPDDASSQRTAIDRMLLAAGLTNTSQTCDQLLGLSTLASDVGGWTIPAILLHYAISTVTSALKEGKSLDVALRRAVFGTLLARAPLHAIPYLAKVARSMFGSQRETLYIPQMGAAIAEAFAEEGMVLTSELQGKCKAIVDFILTEQEGVIIIRGEARVGKHSVVRAAISVVSKVATKPTTVTIGSSSEAPKTPVDVLVQLNLTTDIVALRPAAKKVILLTDIDTLPPRVVSDTNVTVLLIEQSITPSAFLGLTAQPLVANVVTELLTAHEDSLVAAAVACGNPSSTVRIRATLMSILKSLLATVSVPTEDSIEKAFWFAASWACAPHQPPAWLDYAVPRIRSDLLPQPDLFSCGLSKTGEWVPWVQHTTLRTPMACASVSRCVALLTLLRDAGEGVFIVGTEAIATAVALAAGTKAAPVATASVPSFITEPYRRLELPHVWHARTSPAHSPLPLVCIADVLSSEDCESVSGPVGQAFQHLAGSIYKDAATLAALAAVMEIVGKSDKSDEVCRVAVRTIAEGHVHPDDHLGLAALFGDEELVLVVQGGSVSVSPHAAAAKASESDLSTTRFKNAMAALMLASSVSSVITAARGCKESVQASLEEAASAAGKTIEVVEAEPKPPTASGRVCIYRPAALPTTQEMVTLLALNIIIDLSALVVPEEYHRAILQLSALVFTFTFTPADQKFILRQRGHGESAIFGAIVDTLPAHTLTPKVFQSALRMFERVRNENVERGGSTSAVARNAVRSYKQLEQRLAKKPLLSQLEKDYKGPGEGIQHFTGRVAYTDYPPEAVRLMLYSKMDDKGNFKEFTHVSTFIGQSQSDVICVTATEGGSCRARKDPNGSMVVTAPPYELRLMPTEDGGFSGTIVEVAKGSAPIGAITLEQCQGEGTMLWLKGIEAGTDEDPMDGSQKGEDKERLTTAANAALRVVLKLGDQKLRESFATANSADQLAFSASLLLFTASLDCQARSAFVESIQALYQQEHGTALPDPLSKETAATILGESPASLALWLGSQRPDLPPGPHGEQVALAMRAIRSVGLEPIIFDPTGVFKAWAAKHGVARQIKESSSASLINGEHTVTSLAAALSAAGAKIDITALTTSADQDQQNRDAVAALLRDGDGLGSDDLFDFLVAPKTQELLGKVSLVADAPTVPKPKKGADKEGASAPFRLAAIVIHCARLLPSIQPIYAIATKDLIAIATVALQATPKAGQSLVDAAVKAFGAQVLSTVLQEDRLLLSAGLAMAVLIEEKRADPAAFGLALRMLRNADPSSLDEANAALLEAAHAAFADWQRVQDASKARKKDNKELKDFLDPKITPSYPFMGPQQWANVLCLAESVPSLATLPAALQHGDLPKGTTKQERWAEWLDNCIGPLPTYEKNSTLSPLDQLLVILALRPSKLVVGLLQFVVETLGADFPDPYALDDPVPIVVQASKVSKRAVVLHSSIAAPQTIQQTVINAAKTSRDKPPTVYIESALFPHRAKDAIAAAVPGHDWVLIEDCDKVPESIMKDLTRVGLPEGYNGTVFYSVAPTSDLSATVFASIPRVTCNFVWSLRRTMQHHYATIQSQHVPLAPGVGHRLVFVVTFLVTALEQRSRFGTLGFTSSKNFSTCERDVTAAVSAVLKATATGGEVQWNALRDQLFVILSGLAHTNRDRSIVQAYIDWLIHPQVVLGDNELGNGVAIPHQPTYDNHFLTISQLPDTTSTEMIGLNTGVELRQREQESERIFVFLEDSFVPNPSAESVAELVDQVIGALPALSAHTKASAIANAATSPTAVPTMLVKEWTGFERQLQTVKATLKKVRTLSATWRTIFVQQRVPSEWERPDEPHGSIQAFVASLQSTFNQLSAWSADGKLPQVLLVAGLSDAKGLMAATRYDASLELRLPLAAVAAHFEVCAELPADYQASGSLSSQGLYLASLHMVGTLIDKKKMLQELFEHAIFWWQMPGTEVEGVHVTFGPATSGDAAGEQSRAIIAPQRPATAFHNSTSRSVPVNPRALNNRRTSVSKRGVFAAPFYATPSQRPEDFIGYVPIECFEDHNYWVLRGAAVVGNM